MTTPSAYTQAYTQGPTCLVCKHSLDVRPSEGRKSKKPFIMLICPVDGRHFRGFITHQDYVREVMEQLKAAEGPSEE